ncbi:MAG: hypothetical protein JWM78_1731 [Verrucomicrobiaceae bacterium]|nr:hypothetical protein [Verrucomicrobiaceae bacterium]
MQKSKSVMLAAATAALFAGGLTVTSVVHAEEAVVHCAGINSCKGTSDCKTAENSCKGQNTCKGHGFKAVTKAECDSKGGKVTQ